ncbi:MAG TPA: LOG family protein [Ktedonobacteraceae bacterium]|jgi:uncharacterized protein (TIGR00730 family)|nr:LOG family protein [Ktedonobacteraceae bacterium]
MSEDTAMHESKPARTVGVEVAVIGSARLSESDDRWSQAHKLGRLLAQEGFTIVTGGYSGLMAAVSRGAHEVGGYVIGLPMRHWTHIEPNPWNTDLRWSANYGMRLNHLLHCEAVVALPGGVGTLSELAIVWAAGQTEVRGLPLILLGECWGPVIQAVDEHLVIDDADLDLLRFAASPEEALHEIRAALANRRAVPGSQG